MTTSPRAALFDMDRTLVRKETATLFVRYQRDRGEATWKDLVRALYDAYGHTHCGIYLSILTGGRVAAGDMVSLCDQGVLTQA